MSYNYVFEFISYIFNYRIPNYFEPSHRNSYHTKIFDVLFNNMPKGIIRISKIQRIYDERQRKFDLERVLGDLGKWDKL